MNSLWVFLCFSVVAVAVGGGNKLECPEPRGKRLGGNALGRSPRPPGGHAAETRGHDEPE